MNGRVIALGLLLLCVAADARETFRLSREPNCPNREPGFCTLEYRPVCGSNGVTYPNECFMCADLENNNGLKIVSNGECPSPEWNWFS